MKITLYTITDCQYCKAEKEYLASKGLQFEEKNLESNKEFLTEMLTASNNFAGVPFTVITKDDGSVHKLEGFTAEDFDKVLSATSTPAVANQMSDSNLMTTAPMTQENLSMPPQATPKMTPSTMPSTSAPTVTTPTMPVTPNTMDATSNTTMPVDTMPPMNNIPSSTPAAMSTTWPTTTTDANMAMPSIPGNIAMDTAMNNAPMTSTTMPTMSANTAPNMPTSATPSPSDQLDAL